MRTQIDVIAGMGWTASRDHRFLVGYSRRATNMPQSEKAPLIEQMIAFAVGDPIPQFVGVGRSDAR
jgi:hypothetical protein